MILRLTCSVTWAGLLVSIIAGPAWVEGEDECYVDDSSKSNGTGPDCRPQHGMYGYEVLNHGVGKKRRTTGDYASMDELPSEYTDEGKSSDGKDVLSKSSSSSAIKKVLSDVRSNKKPKKNINHSAGTSAYRYKERLGKEPVGCGYPVCVEVDMRLKRFTSMCAFSKWMKEGNHQNRVFMVQKGDCGHIIENKEPARSYRKKPWAKNFGRKKKGSPPPWKACHKHDGCNTEICLNDDGVAKTFPNVRQAMLYMKNGYRRGSYYQKKRRAMRELNVIAVGLGNCADLYQKGCINTEWFDLDDPVSDGVEEESVPYAHQLVISTDPPKMKTRFTQKGKEVSMDSGEMIRKNGKATYVENPHLGIHRSCPPEEIKGDAEFRTTSGESHVKEGKSGCRYSDTTLAFKCKSYKNKDPLPKEFSWDIVKKNVTCRDWKFRYCCLDMWGEAASYGNIVRVDKPHIKSLTQGCKWRQYMSTPKNDQGDNEAKDVYQRKLLKKALKGAMSRKANICGGYALGTRFIDVRTNDEEMIPYDEVPNQNILKISATYGFICKGKNCKDYKVAYCCVKDNKKIQTGQWSKWGEWSSCDQSCGGGIMKRTRKCTDGEGECYAPMDKPKEQEKACNEKIECPTGPEPGPSAAHWTAWSAWSDCSKSCGPGKQKSHRYCMGEGCNKKRESKDKECRSEECPRYEWGEWSPWAGCNWEKCDKVSTATRQRKCLNKAKDDMVCDDAECEGGEEAATETGGKCPYKPCKQDGGWSEWDDWGFCNEFCEKVRHRRCDSPPQKGTGKPCEGPSLEAKKCKDPPEGKKCPEKEPCRYSEWGMWSSCSIFCGDEAKAGEGVRERHRHVMSQNVKECKGGKDKTEIKQIEECIHCNGLNDEKYNSKSAEDFEHMKKTCLKQCPSDCEYGLWGAWESPGGSCVFCRDSKSPQTFEEASERMRTRTVTKEAENGGRPCDESKLKQQEACPEIGKCDEWKQWCEWTECTAKGRGCKSATGMQERKRTCRNGKKCAIKVEVDTKEGCLHMCKETEPYGQWSKWTPCKTESKEENGQSCGTGIRSRSRKCHKFISKTGGAKAVEKFCRYGETHSVEENCDLGPCERYSETGYGYS